MTCKFKSDKGLRESILNGINIVTATVGSTLGAKGRNVILQRKNAAPIITKDGVTVAKHIELEDPFENVGAEILKQAAAKTNLEAGDGTTTSVVLAGAILNAAQKYIVAGAAPIELKIGIDKAVDDIVDHLKDMSRPIKSKDEVLQIATISANGDKSVGRLIATAVDAVGKDGAITIEEARSVETSLELVEGFRFDSGYLSPKFINNVRQGAVKYENPLILATDTRIQTVNELMPVLEIVARESRPFILIADEIEGQALAALIMNAVRGTMKIAAIKAPHYGEERKNIIKDLAISVGANLVSPDTGLKIADVELKDLGYAKGIEILKNSTTIMDGGGDNEDIEQRIDMLKAELDQTESMSECEKIQERITRLASGVAVIYVGGATEIEMVEKKHRIEDALEAVRSAQAEGIVPGGGVALFRAGQLVHITLENENQALGAKVLLKAIEEPIRQMAKNAGRSPDLILSSIKTTDNNQGYDFKNDQLVDMIEAGIIDPVKVTRCALQNAASVSSMLITANHGIIEI